MSLGFFFPDSAIVNRHFSPPFGRICLELFPCTLSPIGFFSQANQSDRVTSYAPPGHSGLSVVSCGFMFFNMTFIGVIAAFVGVTTPVTHL